MIKPKKLYTNNLYLFATAMRTIYLTTKHKLTLLLSLLLLKLKAICFPCLPILIAYEYGFRTLLGKGSLLK